MTEKTKTRTSLGEGDNKELEVFVVGGEDVNVSKSEFTDFDVAATVSGMTTQTLISGDAIEKVPFDIDKWVLAPEISTRLSACIFVRSRNTAGMGYELIPKKNVQRELEKYRKESSEEENRKKDELVANIQAEKDKAEELLENPNPKKSFMKIMQMVIADKEAVGNGYLEVRREPLSAQGKKEGEPMYLDRVFGHSIRRKVKGGFVELVNSKTVKHYKEWGDKRIINKKTGKEHNPGKDGAITPEDRATELIPFIVDPIRRTKYGMPRHISCGPTIAGNRFASERNAVFFENDATPRMAIVVQGPYRLSKESRDDIKEFIETKGKGKDGAGRVLVIQAGKKEGSVTESEDVKITFEKLTVGLAEEASFLKYQDRGDREIAEAFNLHPVFFEKDATRASANIGRSITLDQVFEPELADHEYILNQTIIKALGVELIQLRLKRPKIVDEEGQATIFQKLHRIGGITPNDIRDFLGKPRFKENWGDYPLALALQQLKVPQDRSQGDLVTGLLNVGGGDKLETGQVETGEGLQTQQGDINKSMSPFELITALISLDKMIDSAVSKKIKSGEKSDG